MTWRVAESLLVLRDQVNTVAPGRSRASDGTIGDVAHKSRASDHNAWVDGNVVTALDVTHDPRHAMDCTILADQLVASKDDRIKYIIWNRRIWNPSVGPNWRVYRGKNPHTLHLHLSVRPEKRLYDAKDKWSVKAQGIQTSFPIVKEHPLVTKGHADSTDVRRIKDELSAHMYEENGFGPLTEEFVKAFQRARKLDIDGKVGQYTWRELLK